MSLSVHLSPSPCCILAAKSPISSPRDKASFVGMASHVLASIWYPFQLEEIKLVTPGCPWTRGSEKGLEQDMLHESTLGHISHCSAQILVNNLLRPLPSPLAPSSGRWHFPCASDLVLWYLTVASPSPNQVTPLASFPAQTCGMVSS